MQGDVELLHLRVVVPQAAQGGGHPPHVAAGVARPLPVVAARSSGTSRSRRRGRRRPRRARSSAAAARPSRSSARRRTTARTPARPARPDVPQHASSARSRRGSTGRSTSSRRTGRGRPRPASRHGRQPEAGAQPVGRGAAAPAPRRGSASRARGVVAVDQQAAEAGERPEHEEAVEQRGAAVHEVRGRRRRAAGRRRSRAGSSGTAGGRSGRASGSTACRAAPPRTASRTSRRAEEPLAGRDHPLADRRVHDEVAAVVREDVRGRRLVNRSSASLSEFGPGELVRRSGGGARVLDVVRLVEHQLVRAAEVPEPQKPPTSGDQQRARPAPEPVASARRRAAGPAGPGSPRRRAGRRVRARRAIRPARGGAACEPPAQPLLSTAVVVRGRARAGSPAPRRTGRRAIGRDRAMVSPPAGPAGRGSGRAAGSAPGGRRGGGVLVLAATPIGDVADAPPRLAGELAAPTSSPPRTPAGCAGSPALGVEPTGRIVSLPRAQRGRPGPPNSSRRCRRAARVLLVTDAGMPSRLRPRVPAGRRRRRGRTSG